MYARLPVALRKALYPLELKIRAIRQRRLDEITKVAMTRVLDAVAARDPAIRKHFFYGASAIHPRHLVTWYIFYTDRDLETARQNGLTSDLDALTRAELLNRGYPTKGAHVMHVAFTSEEDVQNKSGGNYYAYFK
jgi:hypothetical protein